MRFVSSHDVSKAFGRYQDEALGEEPIAVTRYGRPTVVILSYAEYERLSRGKPTPSPRREVFRAGAIPDDLVAELESVSAPDDAIAFDAEVDDERPG